MVYTPDIIPAPPTPATALPTIKVVGLLATPQMRLPTSKMKMEMIKVVFSGKYLYAFPHVDWKDASVMRKAEPYLGVLLVAEGNIVGVRAYHPTWSTE
jgi:hypothetical protein